MKLGNFKSKFLRLFAITGVILSLTSAFISPLEIKASNDGPKFNFQSADPKTLRGINRTKAENNWQASITGNAGDEFRGLVYVHNGMQNTVAHNTRVRVTIPAETSGNKATITTTITADNAPTVTDTMTVDLSADATLQFMPGKTAFFPNVNNRADVQFPFPGGQSGDEIAAASGVAISNPPSGPVGDVTGCFDFINYISFGFKTIPKQAPPVQNANFEILKTVRNASANEKDFVKSNFAQPGDILEYKIDFSNTGNAAADVFVQDQIPAKTTFVSGSASITRTGDPKLSNSLVGEGVSIPSVAAGEKVTIKFRVKVNSDAKDNEVLVNTVTLFFNKISISDTAKTTVKLAVIPTPPTPEKPTPLPVTGPVETASALVSLSGMGMFGFLKYRKYMALKETKMIGELLNQ